MTVSKGWCGDKRHDQQAQTETRTEKATKGDTVITWQCDQCSRTTELDENLGLVVPDEWLITHDEILCESCADSVDAMVGGTIHYE